MFLFLEEVSRQDDELLSSCVKRSGLRGNCDQSAMSSSQGMEHALNGKHETHVLCQIFEVKHVELVIS